MAGVNKAIIVGNLGADPDMRYMPNGDAVANISVATSDNWTDKQTGEKRERTEWHRVVAFRKLGEIIGQYCRKGSKIYIEGKLQTRKWTDKQGVDRYTTEIIADQMQMLDSRSGGSSEFMNNPASQQAEYGASVPQNQATGGQANNPLPTKPAAPQAEKNYGPVIDDNGFDDDDIPF